MSNLEKYAKTLLGADRESIFERVSNQYSDDLLDFGNFQEDYLDFLVSIYSKPEFFLKKGAYHFLAVVGVDTDIMSAEQLKTIAKALIENFIDYEDEMLCLTTCDFIARYYPFDEAKKILLMLKEIEKGKKEQGFANDGLRILNNERIRAEKEE
jgi:hypothetical protein